jgi:hypothetical protein
MPPYFKPRFEVFFRALLSVKASRIAVRIFPSAIGSQGVIPIAFSFINPFPRMIFSG